MNTVNLNINLSFQQTLDAVKQLSSSEKNKLYEFLWSEGMDIPTDHQEIVLSRVKEVQKNPPKC